MEALPDLKSLVDDELRALIRQLIEEEQEVSYRRRLLHGKIDILRAELVARLQRQVDEGESLTGDVDRRAADRDPRVEGAPAERGT